MPSSSSLRRAIRNRFDTFDAIAALLVLALVVFVLVTFRDYAVSNDEEVQHRYGELIVSYYASGFRDLALFHYGNLYLYGGLFDVIAVLLGKVLPADIFAIRHLLCAFIGIAGIVATWATARSIAGPRAGLFAALALTACGPWLGTMFNHTKDVPFAAAMIGAIYFLLRATRFLPRARLRDLALFGLLMGAALGQRALGLLLAAEVAIAIAIHSPRPFAPATALRFFGKSFVLFVPAFGLAYLVMIAAWPWAATGLFNPIRAVFAFAHFQYPIKTLLDGHVYLMAETPRAYVPIYLAIKLPLIMLAGGALALLTLGLTHRPSGAADQLRRLETAFMAIVVALPIALQVAGHGPAFTGMRHFLFVVPPLAVLAGIGFDNLLTMLERRRRIWAGAAFALMSAGYVWTAAALVRLHPYEYLYFNEVTGGLSGAASRYDTDYWVNVMHEAVVSLENYLDREGDTSNRYFVAVCGERSAFEHEAAPRHRLAWATDDDPADFFIAPTHMRCDDAVDGTVVVRIERMGTLVGVVKDRRENTRAELARRR